jgi:hypothetical protein
VVRPWLKRVALWCIPTLLLVLAWQAWDRFESAQLRQAVDALGADRSAPAPEGDESGWRLYSAADILIETPATIYPVLASLRYALASDRAVDGRARQSAAQFVERNRQGLQLATEAADRVLGPTTGVSSLIGDRFRSPRVANAYALAMLDAVVNERIDEAAAVAVSRVRLMRVFDREASVLNVMMKADATDALARDISLLLGRPVPRARLDALDGALASVFSSADIARAIRGEARWRHTTTMRLLRATAVSAPPFAHPLRPLWWREAAEGQRLAGRCLAAAGRPWPEPLSAMPRPLGEPKAGWMSAVVAPSGLADLCQRSTRVVARSLAMLGAVQLALRIERERNGTGSTAGAIPGALPESFTPSTGAAVDPYTGQRFHYKALADGYAVYSVGPDGRDDGGDVSVPSSTTMNRMTPGTDVGVRVRIRPPVRSAGSRKG